MIIRGKVYKYGSDVNTDVIIPARYLNVASADELKKYCMQDIDENFAKTVVEGDIIVSDENFGCGSSREHAPLAIKASGIQIVIAKSFARIFYRNALNIGLNIQENLQIPDECNNGDVLEIDYDKSTVKNITTKKEYKIQKFDGFLKTLVSNNGLIECVKGGKL